MKITLSSLMAHTLAEAFAQTIIGRVLEQRHALIEGQRPQYFAYSGFTEMQQAIRSVPAGERREFIWTIRWQLQRLQAERSHDIRGRDYVAKVHAYRASQREVAA